jgi:hypothetical protein
LSEKISNNFDSSNSVIGVSKPNTDVNAISPLHFETYNFSKNYLIIVCGVSRDSRYFKQFSMQISNSNIIILDAPHRHDLEENSCVNKEVTVFSRKLHKIVEPFQHVQLLKMNVNRNFYTRHGLHMNSSGKSWISDNIVKYVCSFLS